MVATIERAAPAATLEAHQAPVFIGAVTLRAHDLQALTAYYRDVIGLGLIRQDAGSAELGVGGQVLVRLVAGAARPTSTAGLFHLAILLPSRRDLANWLRHAAVTRIPLEGASDHLVSEALYLSDPEGNGIEIYRDRDRSEWTYVPDGTVKMATNRLDLQALYDEAPKDEWAGQESGTVIGHLHLQVSDIPQADAFFQGILGLDVMARYPGASFFASGKYHHHVAANVWNSRGKPKRETGMTGLADYTIRFNDPARLETAVKKLDELAIPTTRANGAVSLVDPWGIGLKLSA